jgi:predicted dehydrogenase
VEKATGEKPRVYQDLRKLYEDKDIDAVSIATPNHLARARDSVGLPGR